MRKVSESEKVANVDGDWRKATRLAEKTNAPLMDWCGLEATLNAYIRETKNTDLDRIVGAFTKRGCELPCPKCGQREHLDFTCDGETWPVES